MLPISSSLGMMLLWWTSMLLVTRRSILDKTSGFPLIAVIAAFPWNIVFAIIYYPTLATIDYISTCGFVVGDIFSIFIILKYLPKEYEHIIPQRYFSFVVFAFLLAMIGYQYFLFTYLTSLVTDVNQSYPSIWLHTQIMHLFFYSVSFIPMLRTRKSTKGQSIYFPLLRVIGNTAYLPKILFYYKIEVAFTYYLIAIITMADLTYMYLLYKQFQKEGINPWRHV